METGKRIGVFGGGRSKDTSIFTQHSQKNRTLEYVQIRRVKKWRFDYETENKSFQCFLLNSINTVSVRDSQANCHQKIWDKFTPALIKEILTKNGEGENPLISQILLFMGSKSGASFTGYGSGYGKENHIIGGHRRVNVFSSYNIWITPCGILLGISFDVCKWFDNTQ